MITRNDIPPKFLFILDCQDVTEKFIDEVNKQTKWERTKAELSKTYRDFIGDAFNWHYTEHGFFSWFANSLQLPETFVKNPKNFTHVL